MIGRFFKRKPEKDAPQPRPDIKKALAENKKASEELLKLLSKDDAVQAVDKIARGFR